MAEDPTSFRHFHRSAVANLDVLRLTDIEIPALDPAGQRHQATDMLLKLYRSTLDRIADKLRDPNTADTAFQQAAAGLNAIEKLRHLLENLTESVKHGASLQDALRRLNEAGLIADETVANMIKVAFVADEVSKSPFFSTLGAGKLLNTLLGGLRKAALTLMEILTNALKAIDKYVALKPKPAIGFAGAFPTFSLQFELEVPSITLSELFHEMIGAHSA